MKKFEELDSDGNGTLDLDELGQLLKKGNPNLSDVEIEKLYFECDTNNDGKIQFEEFVDYIYGKESADHAAGRTSEGRHAKMAANAAPVDDGTEGDWNPCHKAFDDYCHSAHGAKDLDNNHFAKFCRDAHVITKAFKKTDIDLVFSKVVPKGKRRMDFLMFQQAVRLIAQKSGTNNADIMGKFETIHGQDMGNATKTEYSKFYDDKTTFTGAATYNENLGASEAHDKALGRREKTVAAAAAGRDGGDDEDDWDECKRVFMAFADEAGTGNDKLDGREFIKLCVDCELISKKFTKNDVDVCFAVAARKEKQIDFDKFKIAIREMAKKKDEACYVTQKKIADSSGPKKHGATKADAVRFHDDKSTYTGAHGANVGRTDFGDDRHERLAGGQNASLEADEGEHDWAKVQVVYDKYGGADGVASNEFCKICVDCNLFDKKFRKEDMDVLFSRVVTKGQRKLTYEQFQKAVRGIAQKKEVATSEVQTIIGKHTGGPELHGTQAEYVAFHDDKSLYTGAHVGK